MAYALECIDPEVRKTIIQDAYGDKDIYGLLSTAARDNVFPEAWAVDRDSGCYLFSAPVLMRSDSLDRFYLAFVGNRFFYFFSEGQRSDWFSFLPQSTPSEKDIDIVVSEISQAFSAYGRWGSGPLNKRGKPMYVVEPKFREVASQKRDRLIF